MDSITRGDNIMAGATQRLTPPPAWDRFAHWPAIHARLALMILVIMLVVSALAPLMVGKGEIARPPALFPTHQASHSRPRDDDLKLYDAAIMHIRRGENYYDVIVAEHRKAHYPVRPGLAVRLPTLAYLDAAMGVEGAATAPIATIVATTLMIATIWAWWQRLGQETGDAGQQRIGTALIFLGASLGLNRYFFVLHELWAGMLIALAFALHRPRQGAWRGAWLATALALAIRELTLPFVLLLAASALWRRAWREAAAWGLLIALFAAFLAIHLHLIAQQTLPNDVTGPSWFALRGLTGWLSDVVLSSNLRFLPHELAGPLVILMVFGWAGWKSPAGSFGTLLYLGYGLAFMIAGRNDNFYWGAIIAPAMFIGLAFVPMAASSLVKAAMARRNIQKWATVFDH